MKIRKVTSLTALVSFCLLVVTSVVLYIIPQGRVAYWADWRLWGLSKTQWGDIHINLGLLFLLSILLHVYYNWRPILNYLKNRARQVRIFTPEFNVALLLTTAFTIGTLFYVPPFSWVLTFNEALKASAETRYGAPPYGHAELSSLKSLAARTGMDLEQSMAQLRARGVHFQSAHQTLKEIALANRMTPQQVFKIMKTAGAPAAVGEITDMPADPPPGFGRKSLSDICRAYNRDLKVVLEALQAGRVKAAGDQSLREIARISQADPRDIYLIIREAR
jgi:hypothetical protein